MSQIGRKGKIFFVVVVIRCEICGIEGRKKKKFCENFIELVEVRNDFFYYVEYKRKKFPKERKKKESGKKAVKHVFDLWDVLQAATLTHTDVRYFFNTFFKVGRF